MKKLYFIAGYFLFFGLCPTHGQQLFRAPFLSYLGQGIENHKIFFDQLPYDGIGKRVLLEQYPQAWTHTFTRFSLPSSYNIDAFGLIAINSPFSGYRNNPSQAMIIGDQFGNLEGNFFSFSRPRRWYGFDMFNHFNQQLRRKSDWNTNQRFDYAPGRRFSASNTMSYSLSGIQLGLSSFLLDSKEWGGSVLIDPPRKQSSAPVEGYIRDARHWQGSFSAVYPSYQRSYQFSFGAYLTQHTQNLDWQRYQYNGTETQQNYLLTYTQRVKNMNFKLRWQYVKDQSQEKLDALQLRLLDQFWRGIAEWRITMNSRMGFKGHLNVEQRPNQPIAWRPGAQFNWSFGVHNAHALSIFGNTGQRLAKPLNFHLDRLRNNYAIYWDAQPYEVAHKAGLAFNSAISKDSYLKIVLDRTWFKDKIVTRMDRATQRLVFYNFSGELRRTAFEAVLGGRIDYSKKWDAQLMYRLEEWSPDPRLPWQAKQAAQFRLQWKHKQSQLNMHYLFRSPQHIEDLTSFLTPPQSSLYQRFDLTYHLKIKTSWSKKTPQNGFSLSVKCINVLGKNVHNTEVERGSFLPGLEAPYWSDPQLRNIQLSIRQEF